MKKRLLSIILTLALCLSLLPMSALAADGDVTVCYDGVDANGNIIKYDQYGYSRSGPVLKTTDTNLSGKYYIVQESMTINGDLTVDGSGDGGLVLCKGATLIVTGALIHTGGTSFWIFGQSDSGKNAGRLIIENSTGNGAAIRSTANNSQLYINSGELELHGGESGKLVDKVALHSTGGVHKAELDTTTLSHKQWDYVSEIEGQKLVIEYCDHDDDFTYTRDGNAQHKRTCEQCGFVFPVEDCDFNGAGGYAQGNADGHYAKCECGNTATTATQHNMKTTWTDDGLEHTSMCTICGYAPADGKAAQHTYDSQTGECNVCHFKPVAGVPKDNKTNLYASVDEALEEAATHDDEKVTLETKVTDNDDKVIDSYGSFDYAGKSVALVMNWYSLKNNRKPVIEVENGTLTVTGDATLVQNGTTHDLANPAVRVTGGKLVFDGTLTATGASGKYAVEVTGGELTLKAGDVLNGGVSVGGSKYNSVNELLGEKLAFAKKDAPTVIVSGGGESITEDVTVVEHTKHTYNHGTCACGAVCQHSKIDDATGKCTDCGTVFAAAVNGTLSSDMTQAIAKWLRDGGMLKLYADGGKVAFTNVTGKTFTIDLNGYKINCDSQGDTSSLKLNGNTLTIQDSQWGKSNSAFGPIKADKGTLTLESGYLNGLTVEDSSTATLHLHGGQVSNITYSKPIYTLLEDGYALMNSNFTVDPTSIPSGGTTTYTIKNAQLKDIKTTTTGSTAFGSQTIPFTLSLKTGDSKVGLMSFKWYRIDSTSKAATLLASSQDVSSNNGVYTFNANDVTINSDGWTDMTPGEYEVVCVVTGKTSNASHCWQTALTGYKLTVTPASIENANITVTGSLTYNGNEQSPDVTVKLGDKTLELNKDYTISGNTGTNAGKYTTLEITGQGNYEGKQSRISWEIKPASLTVAANGIVSKQYDGTDTANVDVTFTDLQNGETLTKGTDYTVAAKFDNASAGENKTVTGTVTLKNTDKAKNYVLNAGSISTTGTITKGKAPKKTTELYIVNNLERTYTLDLTLPYLDNDTMEYGNYKFELGEIQVNSGYYQVGTATIANGKVNIPIKAVDSKDEKQVGTIKVTLISDNIADCTWTIELHTVNRIIPTGAPTLSKDTITYSEALSTITLSGTMKDGDTVVEGTFAWADSTVKPNAGNYTATWTFTPNDTETYQGTSGTVKITVNKATPTGEPKYTAITTSGKKLSDAGLTTEGGTFSVAGTVQWELPADTEVKANTVYKWVFTPTDSNNYNPIEGSITLYPVSSSGGSSKPSYSVNTPGKTENGSVSLSTKNAVKGSTVTVMVQPESGYVLEKLVVTDKDGKELAVTDLGNGKYSFVMPAGTVKVEASFTEQAKAPAFADVSAEDYYYAPVQWALERGITDGISEDLFGPNQPCTRAQIVTFLWRAAGSPAPKGTSSFADVPAESYYAQAVAWAVENGITTGTGEGTFSPDAPCDRAQSVTFLYRALGGETEGGANFSDVSAESYYADAVAWAAEQGITNGTSSTTFSPNEICTRGQIVTFLYRGYQGK